MAASSSSSSSLSTLKKYDVFISFRGEDTRYNFTDHLYSALSKKKINTYIDENSLEKGDEISPALLKAIEESKISVVVFSENYASSSWCLNELTHILRCKELHNQHVIPVFYHVDPSHVRKQQQCYAVAFALHEERFKDEMDKVIQWRNALSTAANLSGWDVPITRSESKVLDAIVHDILKRLYQMSSNDNFEDLFGMDTHIPQIQSLLDISSSNVRIIGIWGMGGVGKTTLARFIFNQFAFDRFEGCYFFTNVKEEAKKHELDHLRHKLYSELLGENLSSVNQFVKDRLRRKKVLIVLDDVDDTEQMECLAGDRIWFGQGSRIIVTTRDKHVLTGVVADGIYQVPGLHFDAALQLFYSKAFRGKSPDEAYIKLSQRIVEYAKGSPLALKVLGSHLCSRSTREWENELSRLEKVPNSKVQTVLKISYDGLNDDEKDIFLDIACFFRCMDKHFVERILGKCGFSVDIGFGVLIDKSLISITRDNQLWMHDLLQDMGQEIVNQESVKKPGKRSRLWLTQDVCHVLKNNTGTPEVQGISLDLSEISHSITVNPLVFKEMYNLRVLRFFQGFHFRITADWNKCKLVFPQGLEYLSDALRYLHWDDCPLKSLPSNFMPQNIVEMHFQNSHFKRLSKGTQHFGNLKVLNLRYSKNLTQIPDLSGAVELEKIDLTGCTSLRSLHSSNICKLESLNFLNLSSCENFDEFPELPSNIEYLIMSRTRIEQVTQSIGSVSRLRMFFLSNCERLKRLPTSICKLKVLSCLCLNGCTKLEYLPEILEPMECLTNFFIDESGIRQLPPSIGNLIGLRNLNLSNCSNLESVPCNIYDMHVSSLQFSSCSKIQNFPPMSRGLKFLTELDLSDTSVSELPDLFFCLPSLYSMNLCGSMISRISTSIKFSKLRYLRITNCKLLQSLPELPSSLMMVEASGCMSLKAVSISSTAVPEQVPANWSFHSTLVCNDCFMLDCNNVMIEFRVRVLRLLMALLLSSPNYNIWELEAFVDVITSFPGGEIPEWFTHRNEGCSLHVKLPPDWYNADVLGFAICLVLASENDAENLPHHSRNDSFCFLSEYHLKTSCGDHDNNRRTVEVPVYMPEGIPNSDHTIATFVHEKHTDISTTVEMSFRLIDGESHVKLKKAGIRIIYFQDVAESGIISSHKVFRESADLVTKELQQPSFGVGNFDMDEPNPKRNKLSNSPYVRHESVQIKHNTARERNREVRKS